MKSSNHTVRLTKEMVVVGLRVGQLMLKGVESAVQVLLLTEQVLQLAL